MRQINEKYAPPYQYMNNVFRDERGVLVPMRMLSGCVQCNIVERKSGSVCGMHWQRHQPQAKLITCISGEIHDICVDLRVGSPFFRGLFKFTLSAANPSQLFIPKGFAHGFEVISVEPAKVVYFINDEYVPSDERGFNPESLPEGSWMKEHTIISEKDKALQGFDELKEGDIPLMP